MIQESDHASEVVVVK